MSLYSCPSFSAISGRSAHRPPAKDMQNYSLFIGCLGGTWLPCLQREYVSVGSPIICCSKSEKSEEECTRSKSIINGKVGHVFPLILVSVVTAVLRVLRLARLALPRLPPRPRITGAEPK